MLIGGSSGSSAHVCLDAPKSDQLRKALQPGKAVRVTLEGNVDEVTLRDGHADVRMGVKTVAVRPEGRRTISSLIEDKQQKAVR